MLIISGLDTISHPDDVVVGSDNFHYFVERLISNS